MHADCNAIVLVRPTSYSRSLAFKFHSTERPLVVAGRTLWSRLCPSWHMSGCFLRIGSLYFSEFWHGAKNPYEVVHDISITWKNFFCPIKFWKCVKIRSKIVLFLNLNKNLVINLFCNENFYYLLCSGTNYRIWPVWSLDSETDCISRMYQWN